MIQPAAALRHLARHDRLVILAALAAITGLGWLYLLRTAAGMDMAAMPGMATAAPAFAAWSLTDAWLMFVMWLVMMVAMMLPSAAPMILLYAALRKRGHASRVGADVGAFTLAYLLIWAGFSVAATALQWGLESAALLAPELMQAGPVLGGGLLIAAGLYQLTPAKSACLLHCRAPAQFLSSYWQSGAFRIGLRHGAYCLGCCWALMLLLFAFGVMNLLWIAALSVYVLLEKALPVGVLLGRIAGPVLMIAGATKVIAG